MQKFTIDSPKDIIHVGISKLHPILFSKRKTC